MEKRDNYLDYLKAINANINNVEDKLDSLRGMLIVFILFATISIGVLFAFGLRIYYNDNATGETQFSTATQMNEDSHYWQPIYTIGGTPIVKFVDEGKTCYTDLKGSMWCDIIRAFKVETLGGQKTTETPASLDK